MKSFASFALRKFGTLAAAIDTVDVGGGSLLTATNAQLRSTGAVRGPFQYERLWGLGADQAAVTVTVSGDTFTKAGHNLVPGAVLRWTTTGTLPTGLSLNTDFFVHSTPTANTYKVSATLGGSAITTSGGTGTLSYVATVTVQALYRSLPFSGYATGVGVDSAARTANKTIAVRHVRQGKHFLAFYDLTTDAGRGVFYLGDDLQIGTFTADVATNVLTLDSNKAGLAVNADIRFSSTDTLPSPLVAGTTYYVKTKPTDSTLSISATLGGATIDILTTGTGTHSVFDILNNEAYAFLSGPATSQVLAVGLDESAMWFGSRIAGLLMLQNGIDDSVAAQLGRTKTPGVWRKCASNAFPAQPTVALVPPGNDTNRQADLWIPGSTIFTAAVTDVLTVSGKPIVDGTPFQATTTTTLPGGMALATTYYTRDCSYNATSNATTFKIAATLGGAAIDITDAGTGTHTLKSRAGTADLYFRIKSDYEGGVNGNSIFKVAITYSGYNRDIYSTLTGNGTAGNPYIYTVITGSQTGQNSINDVHAFVNGDSKVIPFISAHKSAADATADTSSVAATLLQNGSGTGVSEGFTNKTVTVYLTYFDSGENGYGYESPSSDITSELYITDTAYNDVLVTITPDPTAEGGRFDKIRVYLQFNEGAAAIHSLMGSVNNTSGTKTLQIGSNTEIGAALAEFDQNRPLAHTAIVAASGKTWRGGLPATGYRDRLYVSREATDDQKAPEGVALDEYETIDVPDATVPVQIRALFSDLYRLHVHTNAGIMVVDPSNPANSPHRPAVNVGAINPSCFGMGSNNQIIYIGQDVQPYTFDGARYGRRNVKSAAREAEAIIRAVANVDTIGQDSGKVTSFQDKNGMLWWFFPDTNGVIKGMALDIEQGGLMGPFDYPRAVSSCQMEPERPEIIMQDETGNLFVYNVTAQYDTGADFPAVSTFAPILTTVSPTAGYRGYGYEDYNGSRYLRAAWTTIETGQIDLGDMIREKSFCGISFRPIANSRGILKVTLTGITSGQTVTRVFGEMGQFVDLGPKKLFLGLADSAVKLKLEVLSAEAKLWSIRDVALLFR